MEIRAKSRFDRESINALTRLGLFGKHNPKKAMCFWMIISAVLLVLFAAEFIFVQLMEIDMFFEMVVLFILIAAYILINCYKYFLVPMIRYNALAKLQDAENYFLFTDDLFTAATQCSEYSDEAKMEYSMFVKAFETSRYFFLFQTYNQAFVVDKSTIEGGSAEDIRAKLSLILGNKYIICKY